MDSYNSIYRKFLSDYLVNNKSQSNIRYIYYIPVPTPIATPKWSSTHLRAESNRIVSQRSGEAVSQQVRLGYDLTATIQTLTIPRFIEFQESWEPCYVIKEILTNHTKKGVSTAPFPRVL